MIYTNMTPTDFQAASFHLISVLTQVNRAHGLWHPSPFDRVVEDRRHTVRGNELEGQSKDAVSQHVSHEGCLCVVNSKHLVGWRDTAHLDPQDNCQSQFNRPQGHVCLNSKLTLHFVPEVVVTSKCHWPDIQSCWQCCTGWTGAGCLNLRWGTIVGCISCGSLQMHSTFLICILWQSQETCTHSSCGVY